MFDKMLKKVDVAIQELEILKQDLSAMSAKQQKEPDGDVMDVSRKSLEPVSRLIQSGEKKEEDPFTNFVNGKLKDVINKMGI